MNQKRPKSVPHKIADVDWNTWVPEEKAVLCYVHDSGKVLLIHKKTGLGAGKINAPGGRIQNGETPLQAAIRETREETGITPIRPIQVGELSFVFTNGYSLYGIVFVAFNFEGREFETPEAAPFWCEAHNLPFEQMWADDIHWIPRVFSGEYIKARFIFDSDVMLDKQVEGHKR